MVKFKQPDGLRGLLTLFVIARHWLPDESMPINLMHLIQVVGEAGMYFFFVLSGFLISAILLRNRLAAENTGYVKTAVWKNYFVRRTLRIFPIYYLTLAFLIYFNIAWIRDISGWHLLYLSNIFFYVQDKWGLGGHLWSLSTEEQFYLIWPIIMLFLPLKHLKKIIVGLILIAPLFRVTLNTLHPSIFTQLLTPAVLDALGMGGLLAIYSHQYRSEEGLLKKMDRIIRIAGLVGLALLLLFEFQPFDLPIWKQYHPVHEFFRRSSLALIGVYMVRNSVKGFGGIIKPLLENRVIQFLGTISYGLYLYHNFQPHIFEWFKIPLPFSSWYLLIHFLILVAISTASWFLIELPINNLKKYYPYIKKTDQNTLSNPVVSASERLPH